MQGVLPLYLFIVYPSIIRQNIFAVFLKFTDQKILGRVDRKWNVECGISITPECDPIDPSHHQPQLSQVVQSLIKCRSLKV